MDGRQENPYLAPEVKETNSRKDEQSTSPFPWIRWLVVGCLIQCSLTALLIHLDSIQVVSDSGLCCAFVSASVQFMICVWIGLRLETCSAFLAGQLVNSIVWLTLIATAHITVPRLLLIPIRREVDSILLTIWGSGMLVSAVIVWGSGKFRRSSNSLPEHTGQTV